MKPDVGSKVAVVPSFEMWMMAAFSGSFEVSTRRMFTRFPSGVTTALPSSHAAKSLPSQVVSRAMGLLKVQLAESNRSESDGADIMSAR